MEKLKPTTFVHELGKKRAMSDGIKMMHEIYGSSHVKTCDNPAFRLTHGRKIQLLLSLPPFSPLP